MYFKRMLAVLLILSMVLLAGCGGEAIYNDKADAKDNESSVLGKTGSYEGKDASSKETPLTENQKLIRKLRLTAETEKLDTIISKVEQKVKDLGGYMESSEVDNNDASNRQAELIIRVPSQSLDQFTEIVEKNSNVTSSTETTENITLTYVAVESRVNALKTEQTRLLELLAKANNMTEILQIEERLTQVRTELENVTSELRVYDNQVAYSTIYLSLIEVKEYSEEVPQGFWARIGKGFTSSIKSVFTGVKELMIFLIIALPYLAVFAAVGGGVLFIVKRKKNKIAKTNKEDE